MDSWMSGPGIAGLVLAGTDDSSDHRRRDGLLTGGASRDRMETVGDAFFVTRLRRNTVCGPC